MAPVTITRTNPEGEAEETTYIAVFRENRHFVSGVKTVDTYGGIQDDRDILDPDTSNNCCPGESPAKVVFLKNEAGYGSIEHEFHHSAFSK